MDWPMVIVTASSSAVVSAIVTAFVSRRNSERAIQIENITKERAKWRDKIRRLAIGVYRAAAGSDGVKLNELSLSLRLNLNPTDPEDIAIIAAVSRLVSSSHADEGIIREFSVRIALLLKHDWERAKLEAKGKSRSRTDDLLGISASSLKVVASAAVRPLPYRGDAKERIVIEQIKAAVHRATAKNQKLAMFHFQVLKNADDLEGIDPKEFCKEVSVPESYKTEFTQMMALARLMKEQGTKLISN